MVQTAARGAAGVVLVLLGSLTACSADEEARPLLGAGVGLVKLAPTPPPEAGATVTLTVSSNAPPEAIGGICVSLDRWRDGAWEARWNLQHRSEPRGIIDGEQTCPAIGRQLPTQLTLMLPPDLDSGTWRLGYVWLTPVPEGAGDNPAATTAAYVFEVP